MLLAQRPQFENHCPRKTGNFCSYNKGSFETVSCSSSWILFNEKMTFPQVLVDQQENKFHCVIPTREEEGRPTSR
jgi:hypothetical protein